MAKTKQIPKPSEELVDYSRERRKKRSVDTPFLLLVLILMTIGLIMLLSASYARSYYEEQKAANVFVRQLFFAATGGAFMLIMSRTPLRIFKKWSMRVLLIAVVLMLLVPVIGTDANGAKRWINLGLFTVQPSEIAKIRTSCTRNVSLRKAKNRLV